jgi:hypothetical protein
MSRFKREYKIESSIIGKKVIPIGIVITDDGPLVIEHAKEYKQVMKVLSSTFKTFMRLSRIDKQDNGEDVTNVRCATVINVLGTIVAQMIDNDVFPFKDLSSDELGTLVHQFMDAIVAHQGKPDELQKGVEE